MKKSILFAGVLVFLLPVAVFAMYADADDNKGIHESGTGLEQPELKKATAPVGGDVMVTDLGDVTVENLEAVELRSDDEVLYGQNQGEKAKGMRDPGIGLKESVLKEENKGTGQGLESSNQIKEQKGVDNGNVGSEKAVQRRSQVANSVQEMLKVADRAENSMGQRIRTVAQEQNQIQEQAEVGLEQIKNRNKFVRFFIGPNYGEINSVEQRLENHNEKLGELKQIKDELISEVDVSVIETQIQNMEQVSEELKTELQEQEKGFSLFGWLNRLFNK